MIGAFFRRVALLVRRRRAADELAEEMRLHVELRAARLRDRGLAADDAARGARRHFGNELKLREESRDMWGFAALERTARDARYAWRQLIQRPTWTLAVVATLALGVGANTSIFTVVNAMLFRPAAGEHPERLVWVSTMEGQSGHIRSMSYPGYTNLRDRATTVSGLLAYHGTSFSVGGAPAARVYGKLVSGNYFAVLGIQAAAGRTFAADEDRDPGRAAVVVLSHRLWQEHFGGDPSVVGATTVINGLPVHVIGVAPEGFVGVELGENAELWMPLAWQRHAIPTEPTMLADAGAGWLRLVGRLRDGATAAQADAELGGLWRQTQPPAARPEDERTVHVTAVQGGLDPSNRADLAPVLGLLSIVPLLVLLVACFNVANVLTARNVGRRKEFALRRAIGATRARLVGQLLVESVILAVAAAGAGFLVSFGLTAIIVRFGEVPAEVAAVFHPDWRVLAATMGLAVMATLVFGLAPALTSTRFELLPSLKAEGLTPVSGAGRRRLRGAFVIAQVAVSLAVLITAGLFLRSLSKAINVAPGFEPRGAVVLSLDPALQGYTVERQAAFVSELTGAVSALPGVTAASVSSTLPLSGRLTSTEVEADVAKTRSPAAYASIAPGYFAAMGIDLVRGRDFRAADAASAAPVVIINQTLAARLWPGADAIGQRVRADDRDQPWREVVGIARNGKYGKLTERARGMFYMPVGQHPESPLTLVARTAGDPADLLRALPAVVQRLDRDMPIFRLQLMTDNIRQVVDTQRAAASLLAVFGAITLLLTAIGIYGVAAHTASLRTREIGIRMSLGARAADVLRMFVREALVRAGIGIAFGVVLSATASQLLATFLFGLTPTDAMTFAGAAVILGLVAVVASYIPAHRASRVNPLKALRQD